MLTCEHCRNQSNCVAKRKAVHDPEDIASEQRADARRAAVVGDDLYASDPLTRRGAAHRYLKHGVIEDVDGGRRSQHEGKPHRIGRQWLQQIP